MTLTRALFGTTAEYSDLTSTQYAEALLWLREVGLLDERDKPVAASPIETFSRAIVEGDTAWFADFDTLVRPSGELPADAVAAAEALGIDGPSAWAIVEHAWGRVDTELRSRIGRAGELAVMQSLDASGVPARHVALYSDGYGYDIEAETPEGPLHLEVKATSSARRTVIYLSRHEYEVMLRDSTWRLVFVCLSVDLVATSFQTVSEEWVRGAVPIDSSGEGRWEAARLSIPQDMLSVGLPGV